MNIFVTGSNGYIGSEFIKKIKFFQVEINLFIKKI